MILFLFRMFAIMLAGSVLAMSLVRIAQWWPLRKRLGVGPTMFFAGAALSAVSSLYYRISAVAASAPFSPRDAISTAVLMMFLIGMVSPPRVLAELETQEGG